MQTTFDLLYLRREEQREDHACHKTDPAPCGERVSCGYVKHDGHDFEPDVPGTDSFRHRKAGAYGTAVFSDHRFLVTKECEGITEQELFLHFPEADIILVEGLKHSSYPKYVCGYPEKEADAAKIAEEILRLLEEKRRPCDKGDK